MLPWVLSATMQFRCLTSHFHHDACRQIHASPQIPPCRDREQSTPTKRPRRSMQLHRQCHYIDRARWGECRAGWNCLKKAIWTVEGELWLMSTHARAVSGQSVVLQRPRPLISLSTLIAAPSPAASLFILHHFFTFKFLTTRSLPFIFPS
jgi:hypothetical protein